MASMGQKQTRYIAAGCIVLDEASATVRGEPSSLAYLNRWRDFSTSDDGEAAGSSAGSLPIEVEQFLLCKQPLLSYKPLLLGRWIRLSFSVSVHRPIQGIVVSTQFGTIFSPFCTSLLYLGSSGAFSPPRT